MGKGIVEWLFGPEVIGLIFIIVGFIQKTWPPKHINSLYGYRMPSSKQNQETWDEANRYSARCMIKVGAFIFVLGIIATILISFIPMPGRIKGAIWFFLMIASSMGSAIALIIYRETHG